MSEINDKILATSILLGLFISGFYFKQSADSYNKYLLEEGIILDVSMTDLAIMLSTMMIFGFVSITSYGGLLLIHIIREKRAVKDNPENIIQRHKKAIKLNQQRLGMIETWLKIKGYLNET